MITNAHFTPRDHQTWQILFKNQTPLRDRQIIPEFSRGLQLLGMEESKIPDLQQVNVKLKQLTGWQGVYVNGFAEAAIFFELLAKKQFPIGNFIRDPKDLSYTPAPDVFHDLYGHIPFYTIPEYAFFCEDFGKRALKYRTTPSIIDEFQRLFWFTVEFGLVETPHGRRIFGAGIASSFSECAYALSEKPRIHPFDLEVIRNKHFRIDILQEDLFLLQNQQELYSCLDQFEAKYKG